jgi:hypothetical protein
MKSETVAVTWKSKQADMNAFFMDAKRMQNETKREAEKRGKRHVPGAIL